MRFPAWSALPRSRWIASISSFCWPRNASPSFCVQSSFSLIIEMTWGKPTSALTLSSHVCCLSASSSGAPVRVLLALAKRAASTISSGYVEPIRICATSGSGYRAMGAAIWSSSSGLKGAGPCPAAGACAPSGVGARRASARRGASARNPGDLSHRDSMGRFLSGDAQEHADERHQADTDEEDRHDEGRRVPVIPRHAGDGTEVRPPQIAHHPLVLD